MYPKKFPISLLGVGLALTLQVKAQSQYIQEDVVKVPDITTESQLAGLDVTQKQSSITYLDGLGRPVQTIAYKASPLQHDIVQVAVYDNLGRQTKNYLPYVEADGSGVYRTSALTSQSGFYHNGMSDKVADDDAPFTQAVFENSPLQRLLRQGSVGNGFQPGQHDRSSLSRSNTAADNVISWGPDGSYLGNYAVNTLTAVQFTDEQGVSGLTFTDLSGRMVLKRKLVNESIGGVTETMLDTYYIYNSSGMLSYMVPPKAVSAMRAAANWSLSQTAVSKLLFKFVYDNLGRMVEKTVPGAAALYIVYDPLNRPVLMQDGNLNKAHQWNYMKYDMKGRVISQGVYTDNTYLTRTAMQQYVSSLSYSGSFYEDRSSAAASGYYTNAIFPVSNTEPLAYSYYDDYDLDNNGSPDYSYQSQGMSGEGSATPYTRGMLTAIRKRTVGAGLSNLWLTAVMFYDRKAQLIQTLSNNQLNTGVTNSSTSVLNFTGKVLLTKVVRIAGSTTTTVQSAYSYDHAGRLTAIDQSVNSAAATHLVSYQYNELGQLVMKNLQPSPSAFPDDLVLGSSQSLAAGQSQTITAAHSIKLQAGFKVMQGATFRANIQGSGALQTLDYRYNIRGQLLSMNNSTLTNDGLTNSDSKDAFGMELLYDQTDASLGNTAYYNGQVSAVKWMARAGTLTQRSYRYSYDDQNRLAAASYADRQNGAGNWGNLTAYDEKGITYDQNGNITGLKRNAMAGTAVNEVDNLQYTYDGNQLTNVTDGTGSNYTAVGFKNLTGSAGAYTYDGNGNLLQDAKKGTSFNYNYLNRTDKVTITTSAGRYISYTYEAGGTLIRKQQYDNGTLQKTTDYIDGFVYENNVLAYFGMPEGRMRNTGSALKAEFLITDQQGNVRVSVEDDGNNLPVVRQENSYYPFGLVMTGSAVPQPTQPNKNLYNSGSEWQNDYGDLPDLYQTFYRSYDAALGRFTGVDPEADQYDHLSPYQYAGNNPVLYNDPLGNKLYAPAEIPGVPMRGFGDEGGYYSDFVNRSGAGGGASWMQSPATGSVSSYLQFYGDFAASVMNGQSDVDVTYSGQEVAQVYNTWDNIADGQQFTVTKSQDGNLAVQASYLLPVVEYRDLKTGNYPSWWGNWGSQRGANQGGNGVDWANVRSAGLGLIGGVAEAFVGAATSETGVGALAFFDGVGRVFTNATRLVGAFSNNKELANGPSNWGGYVGKILDSAPMTSRFTKGNAQTILGISNDIGAFLITGGNGSAIEMVISGNGLQQAAAITAYGVNWYTIGDYVTTYGTKK